MSRLLMINEVSIDGTSLQGYFPDDTTFNDLISVFGEPNSGNDGYKTDVEWTGLIDGNVFTIYNYKTGKNYLGDNGLSVEEITDWHIGGVDKQIAVDLVTYFNKQKSIK